MKKEELGKRCTVKEVSKWLKTLEEFRYRKVRNVDARRVASFVNNGMNEEELPKSLQKKWEHKKYGREKHLATKYVETVLNVTLKESVNERSAISLNENATDFWMDMFRPGPIPTTRFIFIFYYFFTYFFVSFIYGFIKPINISTLT